MPIHSTDKGASIFFAKTPDFGQLCSIVCQLERNNTSAGPSPCSFDQSYCSSYTQGRVGQPNILKCRELIFTEPSILASPSLQEEDRIYVIVTRALWLSGKFQERCQKMGLQFSKPMRVIPAVFQACFGYTLKAKLAPSWNKVGERYVQGRDFIIATGLLGAISLEINVTDGEICLAMKPMTIKLPHSVLQEFGVCPPAISHFLCDPHYIISEYVLDNKWCFVLPSLKKGMVHSIMHSLPVSSPFKGYADLRRYWKNTYGYRLPENGGNIVFINIIFPAIGRTIFTYPEFCIRTKQPRTIPRVDSTPVLQAFLADIRKKMPQICDCPLEVTRKPQYTTVTMNSASGQIGSTNLSSLTLVSKPTTVAKRIPTRSLMPIADARHNGGYHQGQLSPYRPLCGQTSMMSNTGYTIKLTSTYPSSSYSSTSSTPHSYFGGYPGDKYSDVRNHSGDTSHRHLSRDAGGLQQSVASSGSYGTRVTASEHHNHQHQPSPRILAEQAHNYLHQQGSNIPSQPGMMDQYQLSPSVTNAAEYQYNYQMSPRNQHQLSSQTMMPPSPWTPHHPNNSPADHMPPVVSSHQLSSGQSNMPPGYNSPYAGTIQQQDTMDGSLPGVQASFRSMQNVQVNGGLDGQAHHGSVKDVQASGELTRSSSQGWKPPSGPVAASGDGASRLAAGQNHTMFSLAVHLKNQPQQNKCDPPSWRKRPSSSSFDSRQTTPASGIQEVSGYPHNQPFQNTATGDGAGTLNHQFDQDNQGTSSWNKSASTFGSNSASKPFVPIFNPKPTKSWTKTSSVSQVSTGPKIRPTFKPHKPKSVSPSTFLSSAGRATKATKVAAPTSFQSRPTSRSPSPSDLVICEDVIPPTQERPPQGRQQPHSTTPHHQQLHSTSTLGPPAVKKHAPTFGTGHASKFKPLAPAGKTPNSHDAVTTTNPNPSPATAAASKKRKQKDNAGGSEAKKSKPRSKPKVQEHVNVQQLAHNDQLSKVNTITLLTWLKEKGVAVTTKDKKADLVAKVMDLINCTAKEA